MIGSIGRIILSERGKRYLRELQDERKHIKDRIEHFYNSQVSGWKNHIEVLKQDERRIAKDINDIKKGRTVYND